MSDKFNEFQNLIFRHKYIDDVQKQLLHRLSMIKVGECAFLFGPTGVGKTTLLKSTKSHIVSKLQVSGQCVTSSAPCLLVSASVADVQKFSWKEFYIQCLLELNEPLVYCMSVIANESDKFVRLRTGYHYKLRLKNAIKYRNVSYLFIDEAHHIFIGLKEYEYMKQLEYVKSLSEQLNVPIILVGTYFLLEFLIQSDQLARRSRDIHFRRYHFENKKEQDHFLKSINTLLNNLPISIDENLLDDLEYFYLGSAGCIGILKDWFIDAVSTAIDSKENILTRTHFELSRMPNDKLRIIFQAALHGESLCSSDRNTIDDLKMWLFIQNKDAPQQPPVQQMLNLVPQKMKGRRKPGERKPKRDKVGPHIHVT